MVREMPSCRERDSGEVDERGGREVGVVSLSETWEGDGR